MCCNKNKRVTSTIIQQSQTSLPSYSEDTRFVHPAMISAAQPTGNTVVVTQTTGRRGCGRRSQCGSGYSPVLPPIVNRQRKCLITGKPKQGGGLIGGVARLVTLPVRMVLGGGRSNNGETYPFVSPERGISGYSTLEAPSQPAGQLINEFDQAKVNGYAPPYYPAEEKRAQTSLQVQEREASPIEMASKWEGRR